MAENQLAPYIAQARDQVHLSWPFVLSVAYDFPSARSTSSSATPRRVLPVSQIVLTYG